MLEPREFWQRTDEMDTGVLLIGFLESWKRVADEVGIEGVDIAENLFASLCRLACRTADEQSRLSMTVFAAYWSARGKERQAVEVLNRWLPMKLSSRKLSLDIVGSWIVLERKAGETAHDLFLRAEAELEARGSGAPPKGPPSAFLRWLGIANGWLSWHGKPKFQPGFQLLPDL